MSFLLCLLGLLRPAVAADAFEGNFRLRRLTVPDSIIDVWYYDSDDPGALDFERPKIRGMLYGGEFVVRQGAANWIFYAEYLKSDLDEGYWDDVEDNEPVDHDDGDWVRPVNFGAVIVGTTLAHEVRFTEDEADVGVGLLFGGGLGIAFMTGKLVQWHDGTNQDNTDPTCLPGADSYERVDVCADDGTKRVPKVLPMLDLTMSAKVDYRRLAHLRIDAGIHNLLYLGIAAGGAF